MSAGDAFTALTGSQTPAGAFDDDRSLSTERIDRDYNARASVSPEKFADAMARYRSATEGARSSLSCQPDIVYDRASGQTLDLYQAGPGTPVFLFVHGGYWRALSKEDSGFMAEAFARQGISTAVVDYTLAPAASLERIVAEVRAAAAFLWREADALAVDRDRLFAGGSSAGGHLAAALLAGGWQAAHGVPEDLVKGGVLLSGLFHLAPVARSFVREWLPLDAASVAALSPALNLPAHGPKIIVAFGEHEPAGFRRQSHEFDRVWRKAGFASTLMEVAGRNHFDVALALGEAGHPLAEAATALIGGAATGRAAAEIPYHAASGAGAATAAQRTVSQ